MIHDYDICLGKQTFILCHVKARKLFVYDRPIATVIMRHEGLNRLPSVLASDRLQLSIRTTLYHLSDITQAELRLRRSRDIPMRFTIQDIFPDGVEAVQCVEHRKPESSLLRA